jgi:hypothetical protein
MIGPAAREDFHAETAPGSSPTAVRHLRRPGRPPARVQVTRSDPVPGSTCSPLTVHENLKSAGTARRRLATAASTA